MMLCPLSLTIKFCILAAVSSKFVRAQEFVNSCKLKIIKLVRLAGSLALLFSRGDLVPALYVSAVITDRHLYEGDIDLTTEQRAAMEAAFNTDDFNSRQRRAVVRFPQKLWKNGQVPYVLDGRLGAEHSLKFDNYNYHKCSA